MRLPVTLIVIFLLFSQTRATRLPSNFKRCNVKDIPCLKDAIQDALPKLKDGIKELAVPPLDPLSIPKMTIGSGNIVKLVQNYENSKIIGFSTAKINDVSFDLVKGKLVLDVEADMAEMNSSYTVNGKIMVLDVFGSGKSMIKLERIKGKFTVDLETFTENNQKFLKATKSDLDLQCGHAVYQFDNLFDGNKELGDNINRVLNDNWKEIFDELCPGYFKAFSISLSNLMNKLFAKIPIEEMFLD